MKNEREVTFSVQKNKTKQKTKKKHDFEKLSFEDEGAILCKLC